MSRAAIFDLDRTLIPGSSARVFGQMLRDVGVDMPSLPGQRAYYGFYGRLGEDPITMRIGRYASRLFAGERVSRVEIAGQMAADVLASTLLDGAQRELERHRNENTRLLLATSAPHELAAPFGKEAGFDDVVCTRYRSIDGRFDGTNETPYIWGRAKADAVAQWAVAAGIDLTQSAAYGDSWYDVPMLQSVGQPIAVNPDLRLRLLARRRSWQRCSWR